MSSRPTAERVRHLFHYEIVTGRLYWRVTNSNRAVSGKLAGTPSDDGYIAIKVDGVRCRAHRLAHLWVTGEWPEDDIDHINGIRTSNAWHNLRPATRSENLQNAKTRVDNTSGIKGLRQKGSRWYARLVISGKERHIGTFLTKDEAAAALRVARETLHGEFARH